MPKLDHKTRLEILRLAQNAESESRVMPSPYAGVGGVSGIGGVKGVMADAQTVIARASAYATFVEGGDLPSKK